MAALPNILLPAEYAARLQAWSRYQLLDAHREHIPTAWWPLRPACFGCPTPCSPWWRATGPPQRPARTHHAPRRPAQLTERVVAEVQAIADIVDQFVAATLKRV